MENFSKQAEKQQLILNINMMRENIGVSKHNFDFLWRKTVEYLREEQETTIKHYNEAIKNKTTMKQKMLAVWLKSLELLRNDIICGNYLEFECEINIEFDNSEMYFGSGWYENNEYLLKCNEVEQLEFLINKIKQELK